MSLSRLLDARFRPHDALLLHLSEYELENVVSFLAAAAADLRVVGLEARADDAHAVSTALGASKARGAIVNRDFVGSYYKAISELEGTRFGENYKFIEFPGLKMLLQTGRDPIPGFYTYESTFVTGALGDPLGKIGRQVSGDSELAFSFADSQLTKRNAFTHGALIEAGTKFGSELGLSFQDRVQVMVPQNKLYGMAVGIVPCIAHASLFILDAPQFVAERQVELLEQERTTTIVATPSTFQKLTSAKNFKPAEGVTKLALVVDQSLALEKSLLSAALAQAKISFPKLATTLVSNVDDRVALGPSVSKKQ